MESTGDATYRRDVMALLAVLTVLGWALVFIAASGANADTDSSLPPCSEGNFLAGTCQPDETGMH